MKSFYSHGKLLLTGEYLVLDGALALAVPTLYGQSLDVKKSDLNTLQWTSYDENKKIWLEASFQLHNNEIVIQGLNDDAVTTRLLEILKAAQHLNPKFLNDSKGYHITTTLGFPKNWGLGTSSTLINNIASWAEVNPYNLLEMTFGGSGYDIACASANKSLTYQLKGQNNEVLNDIQNGSVRDIKTVNFDPSFKNHLYFVYLNQKQNSRDGIAQYRTNTSDLSASILRISKITNAMIACDTLDEFQELMDEHEFIISEIIKQAPIKKHLFNDFKGSIKSLGAWGGDFIMVASEKNPMAYFKDKGYTTIRSYSEMIKN